MKKYILPILALASLTACVDDEGNYSYTPKNDVSVSNIEGEYRMLSKVDVLKIQPELEGTVYGNDESKYEYKWYFCLDGHRNHYEIGKEKNLEWFADLPAGTYTLYFTITDKDTGLESTSSTSVVLGSALERGFMILGNDEGTGLLGIDMIAMPPHANYQQDGIENDTVVVKNVFDNSVLQLKNPVKLQYSGNFRNYKEDFKTLWLYTDDSAYKMTNDDSYDIIGEFNDLGILELDVEGYKRQTMKCMFPGHGRGGTNIISRYMGFVTDQYVVFGNQMYSPNLFLDACNRYSSGSTDYFKPFPYIMLNNNITSGSMINSTNCPILYDMDADRFVKAWSYTGATSCTRFTDRATDAFKFDAALDGRKLFYAENIFNSTGMSCTIMKGNDGSWWIYRFKMASYSWYADTKEAYSVDLGVATDFVNASHYMFSSIRTSIFYTVGSRLYQYDFARNIIGYKDFDGEITVLAPDVASVYGEIDSYIVGTYNATGKGTVYKMYHNADPNTVDFVEDERQIWKTDLKPVSVIWKEN